MLATPIARPIAAPRIRLPGRKWRCRFGGIAPQPRTRPRSSAAAYAAPIGTPAAAPAAASARPSAATTALTDLPTAAQCSVCLNQSERDAPSGESKAVLGLIEVLLGGQYGGEVRDALSVLSHCDLQSAFRSADALPQHVRLFARVQERRDAVLDFLLSLEDGALIID
jgi:hypothetical protein